jgi:serine/threonine protein kinase/TolB-like protein/lipoprotein NlpI
MDSERWKQINELFRSALERIPSERAAFLDQTCGRDEALRSEVETLLDADAKADNFIEKPAAQVASDLIKDQGPDSWVGRKIGPYKIISLAGAGGMGEVYVARDVRLDRQVALKVLPGYIFSNAERLNRFEQEGRAVSALNHPNILSIFDTGHIDNIHFIVTEYIEGETLRQRLSRAVMPLGEALGVAIQVAGALTAAHQAGIIHRDIKPENIMLRPDGIVKVLDFGLSKRTERPASSSQGSSQDRNNTDIGIVMGTANYMSPEQARGEIVDARTDVFSLGTVLYEMVTGRTPFEGASKNEVIAAILSQEAPPLARFLRDIPPELERIVSKALCKDREARYQGIKDLQIDLKTLKADLEFEAKRDRSAPAGWSPGATGNKGEAITRSPAELISPASPRREHYAKDIRRRILVRNVIIGVLLVLVGVGLYFRLRGEKKSTYSLAVLPFTNASSDPGTEYLPDGITESLIDSFSHLPQLRVMARTTVIIYKGSKMDPREIGRKLSVDYVVTGTVIQRGDALLVQADLIDVKTGVELWGAHYNVKLSDILIVQEGMARDISEKLLPPLTGEEKKRLTKRYTESTEAYNLYLKGRYHWQKRTVSQLTKSIGYFQQAIEKDPQYALAYTGIADAYALLGSVGYDALRPREAMPRAEVAALKALQIDDSLAEAHTSLAYIRLMYDWDWPQSQKEFERAIQLNPNDANAHHWYSYWYVTRGQFDQGLTEVRRALELEPLSPTINAALGRHYYFARRYEEALEQCRKTLDLDQNFVLGRLQLGLTLEQMGRYPESIAEFQTVKQLIVASVQMEQNPGGRGPGADLKEIPRFGIWDTLLGNVFAVSGEKTKARNELAQLISLRSTETYVPAYYLGAICVGLGKKDAAFQWLDRAYQERSEVLVDLKVEPYMDSLRSDPRYADLLRRVGLPQ